MLGNSDWEIVNAFADGELTGKERDAFVRRLAVEPELARALEQVASVKHSLGPLCPPRSETPERKRGWVASAAAIAACLALIAGALIHGLGGKSDDWSAAPASVHAWLSQKSYILPETQTLPVVSTARIGDVRAFDLTLSRLVLVDVEAIHEDGREIVGMHYRGVNGCRLTVVAVEALAGDPSDLPEVHAGLGVRWTVAGRHYYVLASGMDRARFEAIAGFVEAESRRDRDAELRIAMHEATSRAQPCA